MCFHRGIMEARWCVADPRAPCRRASWALGAAASRVALASTPECQSTSTSSTLTSTEAKRPLLRCEPTWWAQSWPDERLLWASFLCWTAALLMHSSSWILPLFALKPDSTSFSLIICFWLDERRDRADQTFISSNLLHDLEKSLQLWCHSKINLLCRNV